MYGIILHSESRSCEARRGQDAAQGASTSGAQRQPTVFDPSPHCGLCPCKTTRSRRKWPSSGCQSMAPSWRGSLRSHLATRPPQPPKPMPPACWKVSAFDCPGFSPSQNAGGRRARTRRPTAGRAAARMAGGCIWQALWRQQRPGRATAAQQWGGEGPRLSRWGPQRRAGKENRPFSIWHFCGLRRAGPTMPAAPAVLRCFLPPRCPGDVHGGAP
jgi:hypothetical protein